MVAAQSWVAAGREPLLGILAAGKKQLKPIPSVSPVVQPEHPTQLLRAMPMEKFSQIEHAVFLQG